MHWVGDIGAQEVYNHLADMRLSLDEQRGGNTTIEAIIKKLSNQRSISAVLKCLQIDSALSLRHNQLDAHEHLIAFQNVVLNTHTLQITFQPQLIRPLLITKRMQVKYDAQAQCPEWDAFLAQIFLRDDALIRFVQKAVGLSLNGQVLEEKLFFAYGTGANGKTTFFEVLNKLFAAYHQEIDPTVLIKSKHPDQRMLLENMANLNGVRFATSNEIPERATYNDMAIKQLCSRDPITAKKIYQSVESFHPSHKLWIRSNHKPLFNVHDEGMLRRICLIPFAYKVPTEARIERFEDILLKEQSGILNWIIAGWALYQKERMQTLPATIVNALGEYSRECDTLKQFIDECYITKADASTALKDFTANYNAWCKENNFGGSNARALAGELRKEGYEVATGNRNVLFINGLGVID